MNTTEAIKLTYATIKQADGREVTVAMNANYQHSDQVDVSEELLESHRMTIINLTPHQLNVKTSLWGELIIPPSGMVARCKEERELVDNGLPIKTTRAHFGDVEGLPEPTKDILYVVSAIVLTALGGARPDVVAPGKGIRDEAGRIIGCDGFSVI